MKDKKQGSGKLLAFAVVLVLTVVMALGYLGGFGSAAGIKLGLDLAGGVSITYETVKEKPTQTEIDDTVYKMQQRADTYSTESAVYQEGDRRVVVDIPGVEDANQILQELGKAGSIQFVPVDGNMTMQDDGSYVLDYTIEELYEKDQVIIDGSDISTAKPDTYQETIGVSYIVVLELNSSGASKFATATEKYLNRGIAIVYDGKVISAPTVQAVITNGVATISGQRDMQEASNLASTIRIGALPLELKEVRSNVVGAKLGEEAIKTSLLAGAVGLLLVFLFMIVVYRIPGLAASLALGLYITMELILLNLLEITLTLPGVAGIILSVGMAVDANVIIFTRIREELGTGKTVSSAIKLGFSKALSAIVDGNVTTLIAAAILGVLGSGTVKGFAYTLALGIILSMVTALFVTRFILKALYQVGFDKEKFYGVQKERKTFGFVKLAPKCYIASGLVILVGIVFLFINSSAIGGMFNYGLDFKGGTSTEVFFDGELPANNEVAQFVSGVIGDNEVDVAPVTSDNAIVIKTKELDLDTRTKLSEAFSSEYGVDSERITNESISAAVSGEMKRDAMLAVVIATVCMLIYIWIRFKDFNFGSSAVIALIHDVMAVITLYAVARLTVGTTFIACMLTIVGYSINATIVIFDRIRENKAEMLKKDTLSDVVDRSITQTVSRSINTSLTTFIMVFMLYLFGMDSVKEFALPLMVGIVCGAYSSICVTGTLWYRFKKVFGKKEA